MSVAEILKSVVMISHIKVDGFKSIRNVELELMPINIFIGSNGSGKSNFISFFEFIDYLYSKRLQEYVGLRGGISKFLHKGLEPAEQIQGCLVVGEGAIDYKFVIQPSDDSFVISSEMFGYKGEVFQNTDYTKEAQVKNNNWPNGDQIQQHLLEHKKYHFHDTGQKSPFNNSAHIENDSLGLYDQGENLAAILFKIREFSPKTYSRIVKNIQSIAPFFSDFVLVPNENGYLKLFWQDRYSQFTYGVNDFSDGTIRFIALTVLFMQPDLPATIVLDEPELGLHPVAIAKVAGMIQSAVARGCQVIIATQSADLISYFEPEDIIAVDQKYGCSVFNRLKRADYSVWLEDYSLGDLWQRNIINKGQPFKTA
jgi:predicted ATPase